MTPSTRVISRIIEVLEENKDFLRSSQDLDTLEYEAQEWAKHGFTPEEVGEWTFYGYEGLAHLAKSLRDAGLTPVQGGCAMDELGTKLRPEFGGAEEEEFIKQALRYRNCCPERRTTRPE